MTVDLKSLAHRANAWMVEESFPFWAAHARHAVSGFRERLALDGTAMDDPISRVRLQARQTLCFAYFSTLGCDRDICADMVETGLRVLAEQCTRPDGLLGSTVTLSARLEDDRANLYDTAFGLAACAFCVEAGFQAAAPIGAAISKAIDDCLAMPSPGDGYRELLPAPDKRLQNPHMHLFEASMAWHRATGDLSARERATQIFDLFERRFINAETGWLHEAFNADWSLAGNDRHEIGHFYEWVWLLDLYAQMTNTPISSKAQPLYEAACALTGKDGRIALSHNHDGTVREAVFRTWGQTEALKAHLVAHRHGWPGGLEAAVSTFERMWADHIAPAPSGGWIDRVDANGAPACTDMTAASGYHIYLSFDDVMTAAILAKYGLEPA